VIANDFIPINPYETNVITLGVGQRSDVIVEAVGQSGDAYWMRADLGVPGNGCSFTSGVSPEGLAAVYYEDADTDSIPTTDSSLTADQLTDCGNDPLELTTAFCSLTPAPEADTTDIVTITFGNNGTNFVWFMNNSTFHGDYNDPLLGAVKSGNLTFEDEWNVHDFGTNGTIRMVIQNTFQFSAHPMHLHGHNFHVLAEGFGDWDGTVTNPGNTQMRDVQLVRAAQDANTPAYIVLQWTNDNPGVWPLHCHIAWHVSAGLYINVLEDPAGIQARNFDDTQANTCQNWNTWTGNNIPDEIDSGL
jgi:FtsP/CotA-like multicopper oxidase with cupredoxin domain